MKVKDDSHWMVLNATAWSKDRSQRRSSLLEYIDNGSTHDELSKRLESEVDKANSDRKWRGKAMGFMTAEYSQNSRLDFVRKAGIEEGETRFALLTDRLLDQGKVEDLKRAANDESYRDLLFKEYDL